MGICEQCYQGYSTSNGTCTLTDLSVSGNGGCSLFSNGSCIKCSVSFYFNSNNSCVAVNNQCRVWNQKGECTQCYIGYIISNANCIFDPSNLVSSSITNNPLCSKWDNSTIICLQCANRAYFNTQGICLKIDDNCNTWDRFNGYCLSCYSGYTLTNGSCLLSASNNNQTDFSNLGCNTWNGTTCIKCSFDWVFNPKNICTPISDQCKTNDAKGLCLTCYSGYDLLNGTCTFSPSNFAKPVDGGCKIWDWANSKCSQCSTNWIFNSNGICITVSDQCRTADSQGKCTGCYKGYDLTNGSCIFSPSNTAGPSDLGCKLWNWSNSTCLQCSTRWIFNSQGICMTISNNCNSFDQNSGACLSCYSGYSLANGTCIISISNTAPPSDLGCNTWNGTTCIKCSFDWVFNPKNICTPISDQCKTNDAKGLCLTCYSGYDLLNGTCTFSPSNFAKPVDGGCKIWDWANSKCSQCSTNWIFNSNGICITVSDQCRTADSQGKCTGCYKGYDLTNGSCIFSPSNTAGPSDLGCKLWNWSNSTCLQCSTRWIFNSQGICMTISNNCNSFDQNSGACLSCYSGYSLANGTCIISISNTAPPSDLGCNTWNGTTCIKCSFDWVFNPKNICTPISDQCKTNDAKGLCLTCYSGYDLLNGTCTFSPSNFAKPVDGGCKIWDWANSKCSQCSTNWIFNSNGICITVSDQCRTADSQGKCTGCYKGYDLTNGSCIFSPSNTAGPSDLGCKLWNWSNSTCLQCSFLWVFGSNGICTQVSNNCNSFDQNSGQCLSCYTGYDLLNNSCIYSPKNSASPSDLGCAQWNGTVCISCSYRWIFVNKICTPISNQCKTFNGTSCISCYQGYIISNDSCILSPFNSAAPTDPGCGSWNWNSQICLSCSQGWTFKNGTCRQVSDQCKTYDLISGICTSCYKGYNLVDNSSCVYSLSNLQGPTDLGCNQWAWDNKTCLKCSPSYIMANGSCKSVSDYCKTYDNYTGDCTSCYQGYTLGNGTCTVSLTFCKTSNSSGCISCYSGYALYQKQCVLMQNLANIALYYAECCPEKLAALRAAGRLPSS